MDVNAPLTPAELHRLDALMEAQGGMRLPRLHGYLTAVISGPSLLHPDDWLLKVWEGKESVLQHPQFSASMEGIRRLYNSIQAQLEEQRSFYPLVSAMCIVKDKKTRKQNHFFSNKEFTCESKFTRKLITTTFDATPYTDAFINSDLIGQSAIRGYLRKDTQAGRGGGRPNSPPFRTASCPIKAMGSG